MTRTEPLRLRGIFSWSAFCAATATWFMDLAFSPDSNLLTVGDDLILEIQGTSDCPTLRGYYDPIDPGYNIEEIRFSDGAVWRNIVEPPTWTHIGTEGPDTIFGTPGSDAITGQSGNDAISRNAFLCAQSVCSAEGFLRHSPLTMTACRRSCSRRTAASLPPLVKRPSSETCEDTREAATDDIVLVSFSHACASEDWSSRNRGAGLGAASV